MVTGSTRGIWVDFVAGFVVAVVELELELSNVELEVELARGSSAVLSHRIKVCDKIRRAPDEPHHVLPSGRALSRPLHATEV